MCLVHAATMITFGLLHFSLQHFSYEAILPSTSLPLHPLLPPKPLLAPLHSTLVAQSEQWWHHSTKIQKPTLTRCSSSKMPQALRPSPLVPNQRSKSLTSSMVIRHDTMPGSNKFSSMWEAWTRIEPSLLFCPLSKVGASSAGARPFPKHCTRVDSKSFTMGLVRSTLSLHQF